MQLNLTNNGFIPVASYPAVFYRVSDWNTCRRVADFDNLAEAKAFAISDARETGRRYDHRVETMRMTAAR
jgi:hypothetical protein